MRYSRLLNPFTTDIGIDLGTANTLIYARGRGLVINEPSVVSINRVTQKVEAVGLDAERMLGRTPRSIVAVEPLKDGVIALLEVTQLMLEHFMVKAQRGRRLASPRVVIGVPGDTNEIERRAVEDAAYRARARSVHLVKETIAAAIGTGLPIESPRGQMVIDIGSGATDIAVISLWGVAYECAVRVAGDEMDEAIMDFVKQKYSLVTGKRMAQKIKAGLGSAMPLHTPLSMEVRGKDTVEGLPKTVVLNDAEVREALALPLRTIIETVLSALEHTPPELSADIIEHGIMLTGGCALLRKLDELLAYETGIPVHVAERPLLSVAEGTAKILGDAQFFRRLT